MKNLFTDLLIVLCGVLMICGAAYSQELPNSPGSEKRICYTNADSKGTMQEIPCDQVPKLSNVRDWAPIVVIPAKHTSFWAGRRYTDPPIRTNKEILHSKTFRILAIGLLASSGANLARNWDSQQKHNQPHGGELLFDDLMPTAVNLAMVFGSYKYIWAPIGVGTASYGIFVNTRSAINGVYF